MKKMAFEATLDAVEEGYQWPGTQMQRFAVKAEDLKKYDLQRKKGVDKEYYSIWMLAVGEQGGQMTYFYGHRLLDAAKRAYEWKTSQGAPAVSSG